MKNNTFAKKYLSLVLSLCITLSLFTTTTLLAKDFDATRFDKNDVAAINALMKNSKLSRDSSPLWDELNNAPGQWTFVTWDESSPKRVININFSYLEVYDTLDASKLTELERLTCDGQSITSLNVKGLTKLKYLNCTDCELTSLDLTGCTAINELKCGMNQLKTLDVSKLTHLTKLICDTNPLTSLDVSALKELGSLECYDCSLTSLKVNGAEALSILDCTNNNLTSLDINNTYLGILDCRSNKLANYNAILGRDPESLEVGDLLISFEPQKVPMTATPTASKVLVNGTSIAFDAYNINGSNYFKLRDLASVLSGSDKQFDVTWNATENAINLISGQSYRTVGGELTKGDGKAKAANYSTASIFIDDEISALDAYNIGGNNYFKLRDLMEVFNIGVGWDAPTSTITIDTSLDYEQ